MEILMQRLAGVLFKVRPRQVNRLLDGRIAFTERNAQLPADHYRQLVLADLVALREVRIEIILAREYRLRSHFALDRESEADRAFDSATVEHRQHAGQGEVHGIGLHVRRGAEGRRTPGEDLRARLQLHMRLDADDDFPLFHRL